MKEKDIMNDYLSMIKSSLTGYANIISETDNSQLRETLQQMRNNDEIRQRKIYEIAKQKGYYKPADPADQSEINAVKSQFTMSNS